MKNEANSWLIKGGRVIDPASKHDAVADVLVENGQISTIGQNLTAPDGVETLTVNPKHWVVPGLVDIHVHFRDPGQPAKETTETGAMAALAGGFTSVVLMPNTSPAIDSITTLAYVRQQAERAPINIYVAAASTLAIAGEQMSELSRLADGGAVAFTDDGHCVQQTRLMRRLFEHLAQLELPYMTHAEETSLSEEGCMNEGFYSTRLGFGGVPNESESIIVSRDIELARRTGAHVHLTHLSTRQAVEMIRAAQAQGVKVTGDVTPHHLWFTDADVDESGADPDFKMNPPLRSFVDREALREAVLDGTIAAIATDHAPHTVEEKSRPYPEAPNGVIGLETAFAASWTVLKDQLSPLALIDRLSTGPAKLLNLPAGTLAPGAAADITIIDPDATWTVEPERFYSKARNCPWKQKQLQGQILHTFRHGHHHFEVAKGVIGSKLVLEAL